MNLLRLQNYTGISLKWSVAVVFVATFQNAVAHDLVEQWDADATPILCSMVEESGWLYDEQYETYEPGPITVRVFVGKFHPGVESLLTHIEDLDPVPFFINLQVVTSLSMRSDDMTVSKIEVRLGEKVVSPIRDPEWEDDSLPITYLGGDEAIRFVELLEQGHSPVISVALSDASTFELPISTKGFNIARAMMKTCIQEAARRRIN